jgi:hypothetical protein
MSDERVKSGIFLSACRDLQSQRHIHRVFPFHGQRRASAGVAYIGLVLSGEIPANIVPSGMLSAEYLVLQFQEPPSRGSIRD